jgi:hypothetical protein
MADPLGSSSRGAVIDSRSAFAAAVNDALDAALEQRARRMVWVDADFADWPLDDASVLQRLADWLRLPQRRLVLLANDFEALRLRRPRFVAHYRLWSHAIAAFTPAQDTPVELPGLLLVDDVRLLQLFDKAPWRGDTSSEPATLRAAVERVDAWLQRSEPAFPATTLGL